jgi:hypothetical protein
MTQNKVHYFFKGLFNVLVPYVARANKVCVGHGNLKTIFFKLPSMEVIYYN